MQAILLAILFTNTKIRAIKERWQKISTQTAVILRDIDLPGCCGLCDFGRP